MKDLLHFSATGSPSPEEFIAKATFMMLVWTGIIAIVNFGCKTFAQLIWSRCIPIAEASIPSELPHPNPPGSAIPFNVPLLNATNDQLVSFVAFRGKNPTWFAKELSKKNNDGREYALQLIANDAAAYKGELYGERVKKWTDDHFRLKLKNLSYPFVHRHWNGWSSFWLETCPYIRNMFIASTIVLTEHIINGFILPILYLLTQNQIYYNIALYGEIAFLFYTSVLICASHYLGRDVTVEQMHPAVWNLLLLHHLSSLALCIGSIVFAESVPKDLVCYVLLALLGFTSSLHYVGVMLDFSPISQVDAPYTRLGHHLFCLASQFFFRGLYWVKLIYLAVMHSLEAHGAMISAILVFVLLLFTAFNVDFINFHIKSTRGCIRQINLTNKMK